MVDATEDGSVGSVQHHSTWSTWVRAESCLFSVKIFNIRLTYRSRFVIFPFDRAKKSSRATRAYQTGAADPLDPGGRDILPKHCETLETVVRTCMSFVYVRLFYFTLRRCIVRCLFAIFTSIYIYLPIVSGCNWMQRRIFAPFELAFQYRSYTNLSPFLTDFHVFLRQPARLIYRSRYGSSSNLRLVYLS